MQVLLAAQGTPVPDAAPLIVSVPVPNTCIEFAPELIATTKSPTAEVGSFTLSFAEATVVTRLPPIDTVEPGIGGALERTLLALGAHTVDDVVARSPALDHGDDHFWWVLQVSVHDRHNVTTGIRESRGNRSLMPEIARERDHPHSLVRGASPHKMISLESRLPSFT